MSTAARGSVHSTTSISPFVMPESALRVRNAGRGHFKPRRLSVFSAIGACRIIEACCSFHFQVRVTHDLAPDIGVTTDARPEFLRGTRYRIDEAWCEDIFAKLRVIEDALCLGVDFCDDFRWRAFWRHQPI